MTIRACTCDDSTPILIRVPCNIIHLFLHIWLTVMSHRVRKSRRISSDFRGNCQEPLRCVRPYISSYESRASGTDMLRRCLAKNQPTATRFGPTGCWCRLNTRSFGFSGVRSSAWLPLDRTPLGRVRVFLVLRAASATGFLVVYLVRWHRHLLGQSTATRACGSEREKCSPALSGSPLTVESINREPSRVRIVLMQPVLNSGYIDDGLHPDPVSWRSSLRPSIS